VKEKPSGKRTTRRFATFGALSPHGSQAIFAGLASELNASSEALVNPDEPCKEPNRGFGDYRVFFPMVLYSVQECWATSRVWLSFFINLLMSD